MNETPHPSKGKTISQTISRQNTEQPKRDIPFVSRVLGLPSMSDATSDKLLAPPSVKRGVCKDFPPFFSYAF